MPEQTTKQLAGRIADRNYFKRPERLTSIKHRLALAAIALTAPLAVWGAAVLGFGWKASPVSPGPVATVHAVWETRCDACHQPFHGIHSNDRCDTCHGGTVHFPKQAEHENRCADCHVDHRGREASLLHVSDANCTTCHRELQAVRPNVILTFQRAITDFSRDHPLESRSVRKFKPQEHRALKFSHAVHISPGMVLDPGNKRAFRLNDIQDPAERARYRKLQGATDAADLVQLNCTACHRLDAGDFGFGVDKLGFASKDFAGLPQSPLLPSRAAGGNPLPITYENQCKGCHPLERIVNQETPHRIQPGGLRDFLAGAFANQVLEDRPPDKQLVVRRRLGTPEEPAVQEARKAIDKLVTDAQPRLARSSNGCIKCHLFNDDKEAEDLPFFKRTVRPLRGRDMWYEHAKFTHIAHRAVNCLECHPGASPGTVNSRQQPIELEAALVPEVDKCLHCHSPARKVDGKPAGGARSDCVECHRYHASGTPLTGIGAAHRDPGQGDLKRRLNLDAFLRGEASPGSEPARVGAP
jgi:hypothetical protein